MSDQSVFDQVKLKVDLVDYLTDHAGVEFTSEGRLLVACCPFHEERTPSFKVQDARSGEPWKTWRCFGRCSEGGTIIDAVMRKEGFETAFEAVELLNDIYDLGLQQDRERYERLKRTMAEATASIERSQEEMRSGSKAADIAQRYLRGRGYSDETIDHFGLAVDTSFTKAGRLAIPIHDRANHPIAVSRRALFNDYPCASCGEPVTPKQVRERHHMAERAREREEPPVDWEACPHCAAPKTEARIAWLFHQYPKYREDAGYDKGRVLYNEPASRKALRQDESTLGYFLMEGYADVWACHQAGQLACSSYNSADITEWQAGEAGKLAMSVQPPKPVILVPDFDSTGLAKAAGNIDKLRTAHPNLEVQIIKDLDVGDGAHYKDLGELLQAKGARSVADVLRDKRISADEFLIRQVLEATVPSTGEPAHSKTRQMELIAEILSGVRHRVALDELVPEIAAAWVISDDQARSFLYSNIQGKESLPAEHLIKNVSQAQDEALIYLRDASCIPHGFDALDRLFPGGGTRVGQLSLWLGKSGVGKTALFLQMLRNMSDRGVRSIFFSLEQPPAQLFMRMVCQVLEVPIDEAIEIIKREDPRLSEVRDAFKNVQIIDNVPAEGKAEELQPMTAGRVMKIIHDVNMTRFAEPAQVVAIDHLGIMRVSESAPRSVQNEELQAQGYIVQELFTVCKTMNVYMMILQQLPKEVKQGEPIMSGDMGRGGAKQQDFADYVMGIWRPEQRAELEDEQREALEGQYKLYPAKNRHGPQELCHLWFDKRTQRISEAIEIMPANVHSGSLERAEGEPVRIDGSERGDDADAVEIGAAGARVGDGDGESDFAALEAGVAHAGAGAGSAATAVPPATGTAMTREQIEQQVDAANTLDADAILAELGIATSRGDAELEPDFYE